MPCLVLTGHPSVGKTRIARLIQERVLMRHSKQSNNNNHNNNTTIIDKVVLVNEESVCVDQTKQDCYLDSHHEQATRAALKARVDAALHPPDRHNHNHNNTTTTLVLVDSLNYIKGFRYELYCITKAQQDRHGVLWVLLQQSNSSSETSDRTSTSASTCASTSASAQPQHSNHHHHHTKSLTHAWNQSRPAHERYTDQQMDELVMRYEPPDDRNRWDRPLYRIDVTPRNSYWEDGNHGEQQQQKEEEMHGNPKHGGGCGHMLAAQDALQRSVYNMHSLDQVMDGMDAVRRKPATPTTPTAVVPSQHSTTTTTTTRRPGAASFRRARPVKQDKKQSIATSSDDGKQAETTHPTLTGTANDATIQSRYDEDRHHHANKPFLSLEERIDEILDSFLNHVAPLKEGMSTQQMEAADADTLHQLDRCTQQVCQAIVVAQQQGLEGDRLVVRVVVGLSSSFDVPMKRPTRTVSSVELQRLRQQYLQWAQQHPPDNVTEEGLAKLFVEYVEGQIC